jgi:hypothetical protein
LIAIALIIIIVLFASETILGQFSSIRLIGTRGTLKVVGVGVYWDHNCSSPLYSFDWGNVEPNSLKNITIFIRNEGNEPSRLFLATDNWNPSNASDFIKLSWDYNELLLYPDQTTQVVLTLSIASVTEGITDFTFDIIIGVNG